jgi:hypothetical protein
MLAADRLLVMCQRSPTTGLDHQDGLSVTLTSARAATPTTRMACTTASVRPNNDTRTPTTLRSASIYGSYIDGTSGTGGRK